MSGIASGFDLDAFLAGEREKVDAALRRALNGLLPLLPSGLRGAVEQGVLAGGKRLRPILFLAAYRAAGGREESEALHDLAVSLELVHAYSLMHDDLPCMDDAPLRRGAPTPHTIHGEVATIAGGAALIPLAGIQVERAGAKLGISMEARRELLVLLARAAGSGGMVGGQGLDLLGEGRALPRSELDALHRGKTGALLTASLVMGGVAAGAAATVRGALREYGAEIGLAFQIADDVLDATSNAEALGKLPSDSALGKSTYVSLLGVEGARGEARARVERGVEALRAAGVASPPLEALALYIVERQS